MNRALEFGEAVRIAKAELLRAQADGGLDVSDGREFRMLLWFEQMLSKENRAAIADRMRDTTSEFELDLGTSEALARIGQTLESAEDDPSAFDAACELAAVCLQIGEQPLPKPLALWVTEHLRGQRERPNRHGRYKEMFDRDLAIGRLIYSLINQGMTATRNEVSAEISACDAVAAALEQIGATPASYRSVKRIWTDLSNTVNWSALTPEDGSHPFIVG